jgi:hypothetical protein
VQDRCTIWDERTIGSKIILGTPMELLGDLGQIEVVLVRLEIALILMQDRGMVCAEHAIGSEIIFGALDGTSR